MQFMTKSKRRANFELLRILAMFMVMVLHYLTLTEALPRIGQKVEAGHIPAVFAESLCIVAVNVYVLQSGYFLSAVTFAWRRIFSVVAQTLFYTLGVPPVLVLLGLLPAGALRDPYRLLNGLFPLQAGHYWFVTAYVLLCLFAPFLNAGIEQLGKKRFGQLLVGLLLFFCVGKSFCPLPFATDRYGYDYGWFLCLYLTGAWIRKYGWGFLKSAGRGFLSYLVSTGAIACMELVLLWLCTRVEGLAYYASVPYHYNFVFCLTGAVGLFAFFSHLSLSEEGASASVIRFFSPAVLGVYLLHGQADVAPNWCSWTTRLTGIKGPFLILPAFLFCLLVDKLRGWIFAGAIKAWRRSRHEGKGGRE